MRVKRFLSLVLKEGVTHVAKFNSRKAIISLSLALMFLMIALTPTPAVAAGSPFAGSGTSASPYLITSASQLQQLATLVNNEDTAYTTAYYQMENDIDLSGISNWTPIGFGYNGFSGQFDGNGHYASGMKATATAPASVTGYYGLFGNNKGTIKNLGVINGNLSITAGGRTYYVGSIAGSNSGTIINCYNTSTITGSDSNAGGQAIVSGIASGGTISNCYNTGTVTGMKVNTNGALQTTIVGGISAYDGIISNSYNTGSVTGQNHVGGIVGTSESAYSISDSYNMGSVRGDQFVGGIVGRSSKAISRCYNTGSVTGTGINTGMGTDAIGAIVGVNQSFVNQCYFLDTSSSFGIGRSQGGGSGWATSHTQAEMTQQTNYSGFNFDTVWYHSAGSYPKLRVQLLLPTGLTGVAPTLFGGTDGKITGATTAMEYKLLTAPNYTKATSTEITGLIAGTYNVRYAATTELNAGEIVNVVVADGPRPQAAPAGLMGVAPTSYGLSDGKITGTTTAMEYKLSTATDYTTVTGTEITGLAAGTYNVRYAAKTGYNAGTDAEVVVAVGANADQGVPTETLTGVAPTSYGLSDGKITGTTTAMEYKLSTATDYTPVTGTEITGLAAGTYNVRYAAKTGYNAGTDAEVVVAVGANADQGVPTETLTGVAPTSYGLSDGKITGTTTAMEYKLSTATDYTTVTGTEITGLAAGTYNVRYAAKTGYNAGTDAEVVVAVGVNADQGVPTETLTGVAPTSYGLSDGKITGTTTAMEYKLSTATDYTPVTGTEITGLAAGTYNVRYAAKTGYNAGTDAEVVVAVGANADQGVPTETLTGVAPTSYGLSDGKITGTTTAMEYKLSTATDYTPVTGTEITGLAAGTYNVRYAAKTGYNAGTDAEVVVAVGVNADQGVPTETLTGVAPTSYGLSDGKITGTTTAMEYKLSTATDYTPVTGTEITGLAAGTYNVRYAARTGYNAGTDAEVVVAVGVNADQGVPTETLTGVAPTSYGLSDGKITGTTTAMEYKLSTATDYTTVTGTEITGLAAGTYDVRYAAKTGYNAGTDAEVVVAVGVNADQGVPTETLTGVAPTSYGLSDGKITGTTTAMEYKLSTATDYTPVTGTEITDLAAGTYNVRYAAKTGYNAGTDAEVVVAVGANADQGVPTETLTGVAPTSYGLSDGKITGTTTAMEYKLSTATDYTPVTGTEITGLAAGTYNVRYAAKTGYNAGTDAEVVVAVGANADQGVPTETLTGVAPTSYGLSDGKITGTTTAMEYKLSTATEYTPVTGTEITGLAAGTYNVRYAAKTGFNAGAAVTITVPVCKTPLSSVSISGTAKEGQTLTAIVAPSEAAVTYQWQAGGVDVGTNSATYTVQAEDIGKTITVTATATGSYTGTITSTPTSSVTAIPIRAKINGSSIDGDSLKDVFTKWASAESGRLFSAITSIEITNGSVTSKDWGEMKTQQPYLSGLTSFKVADKVTSVAALPPVWTADQRIFNISSIQEVYIAKLTSIPYGVFMSIGNAGSYTKLTVVNFPDVEDIGNSAFYGCTGLTTANFPKATTIGLYAFSNCSLVTADFPKATTIGTMAFYGCTSLTTASFPMAPSIEGSTFYGCTSLITASFPMATSIGNSAFAGCTSLTTANFPVATSIETGAFWECTSLSEVNFPVVISIGYSAFFRCTSLTTVNFPMATSIGESAFKNCSELGILKLHALSPTVSDANAFEGCPLSRTLSFVDSNGIDLTGAALTAAQNNYKAVSDGDITDTLWYGWYITKADGPALTGVTSDDIANTMTGMTAAMEFSTDGITWTAYNADSPNLPDLTGTVALQVRVAETATHTAGAPNTFNFTTPSTYTLTVNLVGGNSGITGGNYIAGAEVTINAGTKAGYTFSRWTTSNGGTFANATLTSTIFTMPANEVTITAQWIENAASTYTVTFTGGAGATGVAPTQAATAEDGTFALPANPFTKAGYTFAGWSDGTTTYDAGTTYTMPANDVTFTAQWTANAPDNYTITFIGGAGATGVAPTQAATAEDGTFALPANPFTKAGYTFAGWSDGTTTYDAGTTYTMPANDVTFTAQWTANAPDIYTVTFIGGAGATGVAPTQAATAEDGTFALPANPFTKAGYTFAGWSDGATTYDAGTTYTMPANDVTFTAQWTANAPDNYTITFIGGAGATGVAPIQTVTTAASIVVLPANPFVKTGYTFVGWSDGTTTYDAGTTYTMPANDVTFTAQWTANAPDNYTITFIGGAGATGVAPTQAATAEDGTFALPANPFTKAGYTFAGWSDGTTTYDAGTTYTMPANDVTFTAQWTANAPDNYTITFIGGAGATGVAPIQTVTTAASIVVLPANPFVKTGYTFVGWNDGTTTYSAGTTYTMPAENVTFTVQWTANAPDTYTVTFIGGIGATGTAPTQTVTTAASIVVLPANPFVKIGYTFVGWNDGTSTYSAGTTYTMPAENVTFTAQWTANAPDNYTITFIGGIGATGTAPTQTVTTAASIVVLPTNPFTKTGNIFTGWNDGTTTYEAGSTYTMPANDVTFTAQWTADASNTHTVSGTIKDSNNNPVTGATVTLTDTTDSGKTYTGTTDANGNYNIPGVPDGSYTVSVTKGSETLGNGSITVDGDDVTDESADIIVTPPTIPTHTVSGTIKDSNNNPVTGATVTLTDTTDSSKTYTGTTDANGNYSIPGVPDGSYTVTVTKGSENLGTGNITVNGSDVSGGSGNISITTARTPKFSASNVRGLEAVTQNASVTPLSVTAAVTDNGALTYQWYQNSTNSTTNGTPINGATKSNYTPPTDTLGTTYYYVVVTNKVTVGGETKTSINTSSIKKVIVLAVPAATYDISASGSSLSNITLNNTSVMQYQNYTTTLSTDSGYTLPNSITVIMGGVTLVPGVDYIYSKATGELTVYNVTGELSITAVGVLIPTQTYIITFNSNGGSNVAAMRGTYGTAIILPTPTKPGFNFGGWYRDSGFATSYLSNTMGAENITLHAKWEQITYTVTGNVKNEDNTDVNSATVKLRAGSREVVQATTDGSGNFSISGVPSGIYNLVISKGTDQIITLTITVTDDIATGSVTLPQGNKNSVVEVKSGTPDIIVDRLNDFFTSNQFTQDDSNVIDAGGTVEIRLIVEQRAESGDNAAENAQSIKTVAGSGTEIGLFLNLSLSKIVTPTLGGTAEQPIPITELDDALIIDIPLPAELQGKSYYVIYRYHGTEVQTITQTNSDGEYIELSSDGKSIKLHTKKFSTYAIGYTAASRPSKGGGGNGGRITPAPTITSDSNTGGKVTISSDQKTATITPEEGYIISDVLVDGKSVGAIESYTFTDNEKHVIKAVFMKTGVIRLAGVNRVDTALEIAKASYNEKVSNVVLATAENYPDALAGSVLAYKLKAPILLVGSTETDQEKVLDYLKTNLDSSGTVYILGGTAVISNAMEAKITAIGCKNITRLGGTDQYGTSVKIADSLEVKTGTPLVLVSGENYPDALSISSAAGIMQVPILLVQKDRISEEVKQKIATIRPTKLYIIGLEGVVSAAVESDVAQITSLDPANIIRIGGTDRYETSLAVAQYFNLGGQNVCLATGSNFPDALAGSVYAANLKAPILLVDGSLSDNQINYLETRKMTGATLFGGEAVITKDIEEQLRDLLTNKHK